MIFFSLDMACYFSARRVLRNLEKYVLFSEIAVDSTPAIDAVVNSDKVRLRLLKEEEELTKKLEDGDTSVTERLKEVIFISKNLKIYSPKKLYLENVR